MRKIPSKNYMYLALIVIITIILTFSLSKFYHNRYRETSILYNYLPEVTLDDLDTYLIENEIAIIYIDDKYNLNDNKEEKKLKDNIIKYNMNNRFVFLDSNKIDQHFIVSFNQKYHYNFKEEYPMIIIMTKDRVIKTYNELNTSNINFEELK